MPNRPAFLFAVLLPFLTMAACDGASTASGSSDPVASAPNPTPRDFGIPWNAKVPYGSLSDSRDGTVYRTVKIGSQTWMAENLRYSAGGAGTCAFAIADSCEKYGRLYSWIEAMNAQAPSATIPSGVRGICPSGWHIPSSGEWSVLVEAVEANAGDWTAGISLKSTTGWNSGNGYDLYGFRLVPSGYRRESNGIFEEMGTGTYLLSTNAVGSNFLCQSFRSVLDRSDENESRKTSGFSLRCVQDP